MDTVEETRTLSESEQKESFLHRLWRHNKGLFFVSPAIVLWLFVGFYTVIFSVVVSFHKWNGFSELSIFPSYVCEPPGCKYYGFKHYEQFLTPGKRPFNDFMEALQNNLILMFSTTAGVIAISLPLALAMNRASRAISAFRSLLLLPMVTSGIAVYYVWSLIYQPEGILNAILDGIGLDFLVVEEGWLANIYTALPALIIVSIWAGVPMSMLLYLSGLQTIDQEVIEASIVDGAGSWHRLRHIIWPLLRPITVIIMITSLSGGLQGYQMPLLMTDGGPTNHTMVVGLLVYKRAFGGWGTQMGLASAYGWALFVLGLVFSIFSLRGMRVFEE